MIKGGAVGGQRDNILQFRVEIGEKVKKVVVLRVVVGI